MDTYIEYVKHKGAFHLVTQVDTSIVQSLLFIECQERQNDVCVDLCH